MCLHAVYCQLVFTLPCVCCINFLLGDISLSYKLRCILSNKNSQSNVSLKTPLRLSTYIYDYFVTTVSVFGCWFPIVMKQLFLLEFLEELELLSHYHTMVIGTCEKAKTIVRRFKDSLLVMINLKICSYIKWQPCNHPTIACKGQLHQSKNFSHNYLFFMHLFCTLYYIYRMQNW